jgi:hypothetical protein
LGNSDRRTGGFTNKNCSHCNPLVALLHPVELPAIGIYHGVICRGDR